MKRRKPVPYIFKIFSWYLIIDNLQSMAYYNMGNFYYGKNEKPEEVVRNRIWGKVHNKNISWTWKCAFLYYYSACVEYVDYGGFVAVFNKDRNAPIPEKNMKEYSKRMKKKRPFYITLHYYKEPERKTKIRIY